MFALASLMQQGTARLPTPGWDCMAMLQERRAEALECRFALEQQHLADRDPPAYNEFVSRVAASGREFVWSLS